MNKKIKNPPSWPNPNNPPIQSNISLSLIFYWDVFFVCKDVEEKENTPNKKITRKEILGKKSTYGKGSIKRKLKNLK